MKIALGHWDVSTRPARPDVSGPIEMAAVRDRSPRMLSLMAAVDLLADDTLAKFHAIQVSHALDGDLTLLHLADSRTGRGLGPADLEDIPLAPHQTSFFSDDLAATIVETAEASHAGMVMLSVNSRKGYKGAWSYSMAASVLGTTKAPVLLTELNGLRAERTFRCRRVLCALGLDGGDEALAIEADALARRAGADLVLLGITPEPGVALLYEGISFGGRRALSVRLARERIEKVLPFLSAPHQVHMMSGRYLDCLRSAAEKFGADLVAAPRDQTDTHAVLQRIRCPLVSVARRAQPVLGWRKDC